MLQPFLLLARWFNEYILGRLDSASISPGAIEQTGSNIMSGS
ncbi:hypothetical protein KIS4809_1744 [Bacillus sp. ZZV12-4809]|nr:hypothetical protein [Cytobacillus sp. AMY 15.2]KAF0819380.1 hypothetical protein KIS4809_1744 [Bacillus sp. ZZV12-4809]